MIAQNVTAKAYEEKVSAQLQQAKAQLAEFEARAKGKMGQAEIDTINQFKAKHQELDKKRQDRRQLATRRSSKSSLRSTWNWPS